MTCRDCKLFDLAAVQNKRGHVMKNRAGRCLWKSTETWPLSVTSFTNRPTAGYMTADDGHGCQRFIRRELP